jgi:hypothetical protein
METVSETSDTDSIFTRMIARKSLHLISLESYRYSNGLVPRRFGAVHRRQWDCINKDINPTP